jgi:hypothetical protein
VIYATGAADCIQDDAEKYIGQERGLIGSDLADSPWSGGGMGSPVLLLILEVGKES